MRVVIPHNAVRPVNSGMLNGESANFDSVKLVAVAACVAQARSPCANADGTVVAVHVRPEGMAAIIRMLTFVGATGMPASRLAPERLTSPRPVMGQEQQLTMLSSGAN